MKHRLAYAHGHPVAPPSGIAPIARVVLYDNIGAGPHPCHWCKEPVDWKPGGPGAPGALIADHLNHDPTDDSPENLVPSCNPCNGHRTRAGERLRIKDGELTMLWGGKRTRAVERHCNTCDATFLTIPAEVAKGHGRFCSRECMYARNR